MTLVLPLVGVLLGWVLALFSPVLVRLITVRLLGPRLLAEFDEREDCCLHTPEYYRSQVSASGGDGSTTREVFYARVRVTNTKPRIARSVRAWLVRIERKKDQGWERTTYRDSIPLIWSYDPVTVAADIPLDVTQHVDVLRIAPNNPGYQPCLRRYDGVVLDPLQYRTLFQEKGTFRFTVLVSAEDVAPEPVRFAVTWDGTNWPPKGVRA